MYPRKKNSAEELTMVSKYSDRTFGTFVVKFLACLPLLGFSNPPKMV